MATEIVITKALQKSLHQYVRQMQHDLETHHGRMGYGFRSRILAVPGNRYIKIIRQDKTSAGKIISQSDMFFVDAKPGRSYGWVYEAASWAAPRKTYHLKELAV